MSNTPPNAASAIEHDGSVDFKTTVEMDSSHQIHVDSTISGTSNASPDSGSTVDLDNVLLQKRRPTMEAMGFDMSTTSTDQNNAVTAEIEPLADLLERCYIDKVAESKLDANLQQMLDDKNKAEGSDDCSEIDDSANDSLSGCCVRKLPERRRAQNAIFQQWYLNHQKARRGSDDLAVSLNDPHQAKTSASNLVSQELSLQKITSPREYQIELFEKAKSSNIIAVLDTGSGKTMIAVLLLRHTIDTELERRLQGEPHKVSFFLVDSVTLVFQQAAVLEQHLDQKIAHLCGEMGTALWNSSTWQQQFDEHMVIVCTAEILFWCLTRSFISMDKINLLIFDEAHHTKKEHVYARIVRDFYAKMPDRANRPGIFGMTASPVDAKVDIVKAAKSLERLLESSIATVSDVDNLRSFISKPHEVVIEFSRLRGPIRTSLTQTLESRFGNISVLRRYFLRALEASSYLGSWCADRVWMYTFRDDHVGKLERKAEKKFFATEAEGEDLNSILKPIREAQKFISEQNFPSEPAEGQLSSKVLILSDYLRIEFDQDSLTKCLVFVKQRYTAYALREVLSIIGTRNLRLGVLTGVGYNDESADLTASFRQHVLTLRKFRKGELNCLIATSVAEEGLDIPDCNLVIRFDLYDTMIQYVQSKGRARHRDSKYVQMVESGNVFHAQRVREASMSEKIMQNFCRALPHNRTSNLSDTDLERELRKHNHKTYTTPGGAKLTYWSSLTILANFVSSLPHCLGEVPKVSYTTHGNSGGQYISQVFLSSNSPIVSVIGDMESRKSISKRSAAFNACIELIKRGLLDNELRPVYQKQLPAMRNAQLAITSHGTTKYSHMIKPTLWEKTRGSRPENLYLTIIKLYRRDDKECPYAPIVLLTRTKLPEFPSFPLWVDNDSPSDLKVTVISESMIVTDENLDMLTKFTLRYFFELFNKQYEENTTNMDYWIAPSVPNFEQKLSKDATELLDWDLIKSVISNKSDAWDINKPLEWYQRRFIYDPTSGSRHFLSVGVVEGLTPLSPVPSDVASVKKAKNQMKNILNYSTYYFGKKREEMLAIWDINQPVFEANLISARLNFLDEPTRQEKCINTKCFLCPEPLVFSQFPMSFVLMGYAFPCIFHRFEDYLIALELCEKLGLSLSPSLALEAVTKDSDNSEEHKQTQIHFQRGMGKNYERLEFIGDCFLKMVTSIALFAKLPEKKEFDYHVERMVMICNRNLYNAAVQQQIYHYVRSKAFSRRTWYPDGLKLLIGKGALASSQTAKRLQTAKKHPLGDKTIADVCEAIIGASYLSHEGKEGMNMAIRAATIFVQNDMHAFNKWEDYYKVYEMPSFQTQSATAPQLDMAIQIEAKHPYHFRYPRLLRSAFLHPSYPFAYEKVPDYQRLEFLGDSLVDMVCVDFLIKRYPNRDPQWLTEHKMAMASNMFLGALTVHLGFHKHMRTCDSTLEYQIREYVAELEEVEQEFCGAKNYWTQVRDPPKCLPDVIEAYIGAIFVDSEFNFDIVQDFFDRHIRCFFEDMTVYDNFASKHPTTYFNRLMQDRFGCTNYRLMSNATVEDDPRAPRRVIAAVLIHDSVIADGEATSGKVAKVRASEKAVKILDGMIPEMFRRQYGCMCKEDHVNVMEHSEQFNCDSAI